MIRDIRLKDKNQWEKLYKGYADFYKVEMNNNILRMVWNWLQDKNHEVKGLNNLKTVDLGCGNGANLFWLKKLFSNYKECLGMDFNKNLINFAKKNNIFSELKFECSNILKIPKKYYNKFELAISLQTLSWLSDYEKAALEMIKNESKIYCFIIIILGRVNRF